ncbi:hypothetical protein SK128_004989 [Halocaridina rubra]|uniref:Uncharacterized protein n=1 Tax=Halocaridina rubra TaxID=373956 RepID=A0AAN8WPZ9_HALRR
MSARLHQLPPPSAQHPSPSGATFSLRHPTSTRNKYQIRPYYGTDIMEIPNKRQDTYFLQSGGAKVSWVFITTFHCLLIDD